MSAYNILKDLIIPLISPLVAAGAIIWALRAERAKLVLQQEHTLAAAVSSVRREALQLREAYQLIGLYHKQGKTPEPERLSKFDESATRLFTALHGNPLVYEAYFSRNKRGILKKRLPLLFQELEVKLAQAKASKTTEGIVLFALYILLYAQAGYRQDSEEFEVLELIAKSDRSLYSAWWDAA